MKMNHPCSWRSLSSSVSLFVRETDPGALRRGARAGRGMVLEVMANSARRAGAKEESKGGSGLDGYVKSIARALRGIAARDRAADTMRCRRVAATGELTRPRSEGLYRYGIAAGAELS